MFIPIVICALGSITEWLVKGLGDLEITSGGPSTLLYYWDQPEYWDESWRFEETCCHSNFSERPSANAGVENSQRVNNNNNNNEFLNGNLKKKNLTLLIGIIFENF